MLFMLRSACLQIHPLPHSSERLKAVGSLLGFFACCKQRAAFLRVGHPNSYDRLRRVATSYRK